MGTSNKKAKKLARERMARTGERYTEALAAVRLGEEDATVEDDEIGEKKETGPTRLAEVESRLEDLLNEHVPKDVLGSVAALLGERDKIVAKRAAQKGAALAGAAAVVETEDLPLRVVDTKEKLGRAYADLDTAPRMSGVCRVVGLRGRVVGEGELSDEALDALQVTVAGIGGSPNLLSHPISGKFLHPDLLHPFTARPILISPNLGKICVAYDPEKVDLSRFEFSLVAVSFDDLLETVGGAGGLSRAVLQDQVQPEEGETNLRRLAEVTRRRHAGRWEGDERQRHIDYIADRVDREVLPVLLALPVDPQVGYPVLFGSDEPNAPMMASLPNNLPYRYVRLVRQAGVPLVPAGDSVDRAELAKFPSESLERVRSELDEVLGAAEKELPA